MNKKTSALVLLLSLLIVVGCATQDDTSGFADDDMGSGMMNGAGNGNDTMMDEADDSDDTMMESNSTTGNSGTAWGSGAFASNGERIYFTATNEDGEQIDYSGGPGSGGMMMGGELACASCHGPQGRGGEHMMHMEIMDAPAIYWSALAEHGGEEDGHDEAEQQAEGDGHVDEGGYSIETFKLAVVEGQHPDGEPLSADMPRWDMSDEVLRDLAEFLKTLP